MLALKASYRQSHPRTAVTVERDSRCVERRSQHTQGVRSTLCGCCVSTDTYMVSIDTVTAVLGWYCCSAQPATRACLPTNCSPGLPPILQREPACWPATCACLLDCNPSLCQGPDRFFPRSLLVLARQRLEITDSVMRWGVHPEVPVVIQPELLRHRLVD